MPVCGDRSSTRKFAGCGDSDPLYGFTKVFSEAVSDIASISHYDLYTEPNKLLMNRRGTETLKKFFVENSYDPAEYANDPAGLDDLIKMNEAQFENDREAVLEQTFASEINPIIGMTFPLHKNLMMNMVFDKGSIPKYVAESPSFTMGMEYRILVDPEGNELDMFVDQNKLTAAIESSAPTKEIELTLPEQAKTDIVNKVGGVADDSLSIDTMISAVYIENVTIKKGQVKPDGEIATEDETLAGAWFDVRLRFKPGYGSYDRTLTEPVSIATCINKVDTVVQDVINATMHKNKFIIASIYGRVKKVKLKTRIDTSSARVNACTVKWKQKTDLVEIPNAIPVNTTISPEEIKDISALFNVNQLTKIMSLFKDVLANYKDDKIKMALDESYQAMPETQKQYDTYDFTPRKDYAFSTAQWRHESFMDMFDTYISKLIQQLNDPNVEITVFGDPDCVRKVSPTEYTYQTPSNIGAVELDFKKTVQTTDKRTYNFIGSDKMRNSKEFIVILNPKGTDRIIYRIYDYQLYISNEIRQMKNNLLPNLHAFERWKFVEMQPVQGRIGLKNIKGHYGDSVDAGTASNPSNNWRAANEGIFPTPTE